ncbi:hypothetical protein NDU88_006081 [Pleurodeles waltl]|uniref:Uncharacterized protein n=1 Tax=Pleurodeles waltl TaxID=8319 RepID=A0AAV7L4H5_PLEWA|nr:hypothetical protein NDU88_006081 [Pleurodeles waltl]
MKRLAPRVMWSDIDMASTAGSEPCCTVTEMHVPSCAQVRRVTWAHGFMFSMVTVSSTPLSGGTCGMHCGPQGCVFLTRSYFHRWM